MLEYDLKEIRPGHYAKVVNGEIIGMASRGETATYFRQKQRAKIDSGIIEVSLALSALLAILFAQPLPLTFRLVFGICFLMSFYASLSFYTSYIVQRIPMTWDSYFNSKFATKLRNYGVPSSLWIWLMWFYPQQIIRMMIKPREIPFDEQVTEFAYLTLMIAMLWGGATLFVYVLFDTISKT